MATFSQKIRASLAELDQARLEERYSGLPVTPIAEAPLRQPVRIAGEVTSVRIVPSTTSPRLEVTISDGSGRAIGVFLGRRRIAGIRSGSALLLEGVLRDDRGRLTALNPLYLLL